jgi:hypothetical protein
VSIKPARSLNPGGVDSSDVLAELKLVPDDGALGAAGLLTRGTCAESSMSYSSRGVVILLAEVDPGLEDGPPVIDGLPNWRACVALGTSCSLRGVGIRLDTLEVCAALENDCPIDGEAVDGPLAGVNDKFLMSKYPTSSVQTGCCTGFAA